MLIHHARRQARFQRDRLVLQEDQTALARSEPERRFLKQRTAEL
jgi:hypothetical protein